ncbi:acylneuraminate cytidylyltransferase family protein [Lysinibacillus sp. JK80]|uniref:acylneuraminate cytidylyltransferase family protein n=1 Tax=Lysinibacillus TaxID=400634 RepID=UPI001C0F76F9|nr:MULTISPECIES: acylneuraminate cytidylyltransferase family protein [Lysinibacillus]MBU5253536.1 acylneuraminate cytidylyltransferase family protein [Lysinibacillus capsici]UKJ46052.1 acylneuraminate cytidylyltransferase family protein [Lysinibacillus sp. ACHW1.5]WBF56542.1 acylneuraminate cytidylyltransferase family protein [Lysinibacillus sp. JK80]
MTARCLAVIPARGGSKGVPGKNIRLLAGKPLIAWTIEAAKRSKYITTTIVSTDDEEISTVAIEYGAEVPFIRPAHLAEDDTPGVAPILHALEQCPDYDYVVVLQPTSPLRTAEDIDGTIEKMFKNDGDFCVSVAEASQSPYWMYTLNKDDVMQPLIDSPLVVRRQELPKAYILNGAVYVAKVEELKKTESFITSETVAYEMPEERSFDIDVEKDFLVCENIMQPLVE